MNNINLRIGEALKLARENKGLSLRAVSKLVSKSYSAIHAYETGRNSINVDVMKELCDTYGINYLDILQQIYYEDKLKEADSNGNK